MEVLNASEVRKDFSRFIDQVVHERPIVFKRNRDKFYHYQLSRLMRY